MGRMRAGTGVLGYEEAAAVVRREAEALRGKAGSRGVERVRLAQAVGRVVAEPVIADRDQPPFARSARDGYACRAADLAEGPLRVMGQVRAGEVWTGGVLGPGETVEIMTGAPVPEGADTVVMLEHVVLEAGHISMAGPREMAAGENIVPAGAEARAGEQIIPAGRRIGVLQAGAAASYGAGELAVFRQPRVSILTTGDELVEIGERPLGHQIRNSNRYTLTAQVAAAGGEPVALPIVRDQPAATMEAIRAAAGHDLLLLSGGVSRGKFDFVEEALLAEGAEFFFSGARIQPGHPAVFGRLRGVYFFGLPGNPISTIVTFALFAAPLLRALGGERETGPAFRLARLEEEVRVRPGLTRFLPARIESDVRGARVRRIPWQGSGDLSAAAQANAFLVVSETVERLGAGEIVSVLEL